MRSPTARRGSTSASAGGGTHPFQDWSERRIFDKPRFQEISALYGYLSKQFTVFGQHVHIGCPGPDQALVLLHGLSRFIPHLIALSASSPFVQGTDTGFQSARLNSVFAFPLSAGRRSCRAGTTSAPISTRCGDRRGAEHEGLLLGHPPEARVRHDRGARARHAADDREGRGTRRLHPVPGALAARRAAVRAGGRLPALHLQPLPGLPLRPRRQRHRSVDRRASAPCARTSRRP